MYTAWRLLTDKPEEYDVTVYEATAHLGGRLLSVMPGDLLKGKYSGDLRECKTTHDLLKIALIFATAHEQFITLVNRVSESKYQNSAIPTLPVAGGAMDWAVDPFGGGVNFWNAGVDVNKVYWDLMQPFGSADDEKPIYVVGEGYSVFQGWVEGSLWTAEAVLENNYGLSKPDWAPFSVTKS